MKAYQMQQTARYSIDGNNVSIALCTPTQGNSNNVSTRHIEWDSQTVFLPQNDKQQKYPIITSRQQSYQQLTNQSYRGVNQS